MDFIPYYSTKFPLPPFPVAELTVTLASLAPSPSTANKTEPAFDIDPVWKPYYSARESYGSLLDPPINEHDSLDGKFWHRVTEVMERDE